MIYSQTYQSPCGELLIGSFEGKICLCDWTNEPRLSAIKKRVSKYLHTDFFDSPSEATQLVASLLDQYFAGQITSFDIPFIFSGTDFQQKVWKGLMEIAYGETKTYAWLAKKTGNAHAVRAVGTACGANAISILVPCHRIIGSNHSLTGYAGGMETKRFLLEMESKITHKDLFSNL